MSGAGHYGNRKRQRRDGRTTHPGEEVNMLADSRAEIDQKNRLQALGFGLRVNRSTVMLIRSSLSRTA
jgi:hypothetical protein